MRVLFSAVIILSICSCQQKHDPAKTAPKAKKDNVLQEYIEHPLNQAKDLAKEVEDKQQKELDQASGMDE